ncbi:MAG: pyrroline-5-carboxylate reductase [Acidobacteria bacterium]|nr:MAG: pyrroline-5-carboxylate reductase [Acidobacteriota bacterium]
MKDYTLGFIGAGRVTKIMLDGFKRAGTFPRQVVATDLKQETLDALKTRFPSIDTVLNDNQKPCAQDLVFLALHPPAIGAVLDGIRPFVSPNTILVSLAPKISIEKISERLGGFKRIVRLLPNAPSIVNAGFNPTTFSPAFALDEKQDILSLFRVLGECPEVKEETIEAYAITTAMGPTYLWFQLDELQKLGETYGLASNDLQSGLKHMVIGAAKTMFESGLSASEVMDLIPVKPLGEDEAGIRSLYKTKLDALLNKLKAS